MQIHIFPDWIWHYFNRNKTEISCQPKIIAEAQAEDGTYFNVILGNDGGFPTFKLNRYVGDAESGTVENLLEQIALNEVECVEVLNGFYETLMDELKEIEENFPYEPKPESFIRRKFLIC